MQAVFILLLTMIGLASSNQAGTARETAAADNVCATEGPRFDRAFDRPFWNGWGNGPHQQRFQAAKMARLRAADVPKLTLKWAFGFPNATRAYGQPTVVAGRVFVGTATSKVYSLSAESGCTYWTFDADFPVRTAITIGNDARGWSAYFGDQHANAYAVDAVTGKLLWKTRVDEHIISVVTSAPTLASGKLYVAATSGEELIGANPRYECCKFRGSVSALDPATGKVLWKSYTIPEEPKPVRTNKQGTQLWGPSGAGVWSSPTVDLERRAVYVTTGDSYSDPPAATSDAFVAFDSETGKLLWSRQTTAGDAFTVDCDAPPAARGNCPEANGPDFDFGSSAILVRLPNGRRALIAGQKSGMVHAIDPDREGAILWQTRVGRGTRLGGVQWGSAADAGRVYVALSDVELRPTTPGAAGAQPSAFGPLILDPRAGGGLFALALDSGRTVWSTPHPGCSDKPGCSPAQSAAVTVMPGVVFSGGVDGHLRAYATDTGRIVWDVDTAQEYMTVNGVKARGGALDGPGPVVVDGTVFVNSGYAFFGGAPGNVLLAYSTSRK